MVKVIRIAVSNELLAAVRPITQESKKVAITWTTMATAEGPEPSNVMRTPSAHFSTNSIGEYHSQPSRNAITAPTIVASQLILLVSSSNFNLALFEVYL